jgi:membrane-bound inhibitor of C-type lysozyme
VPRRTPETAIGWLRGAVWIGLGIAFGCGPQVRADGRGAVAAEIAPERHTHAYRCEDIAVVASFDASGALDLFLPEQTFRLQRVSSASGAKYADGGVVFWPEGDAARLEWGDAVRSCREDRAASIWEDAKLRGVDFRAVGNEPGWVLEIGPREIVFEYDYGASRATFPLVDPQVDTDARRSVYVLQPDGSAQIAIEGRRCRDSMADEPAYEASVEVVLGARRFRGCGRALH